MTTDALLVIDLQIGAFDGKFVAPIDRAEQVLEAACRLVDHTRAAGGFVIFIQHCAPAGQLLCEGTKPWELHPSLSPLPGDALIRKHESSAFAGTSLQEVLDAEGATDLILCGLQSEFCVSNTAIAALELGLRVAVASDAHSTWPTQECDAAAIVDRQNARLVELGATVQSTEDIVERLSHS